MQLTGNQGQTGKQLGQNIIAAVGEYSELLASELQPRYYEQAYRGQTFVLAAVAQAGTAYLGAAGGTPLVAVWNPTGSGKNLVLLQASTSIVATASAAGTTQFRLYAGPTVAITQATVTVPLNTASLVTSGSVAKGFVNVGLTSGLVGNYLFTLGNYYWATAAGAVISPPLLQDFSGAIIVPPGSYIALGAVTILTSMTNDATLMWSEVPI